MFVSEYLLPVRAAERPTDSLVERNGLDDELLENVCAVASTTTMNDPTIGKVLRLLYIFRAVEMTRGQCSPISDLERPKPLLSVKLFHTLN